MIEKLKELFFVPKTGKIREKTMTAHLTLTAAIVVICLAAMSFSAYAFFSSNVTSVPNVIKAASFDVEIALKDGSQAPVQVTRTGRFTQTATLPIGTYSVKILPTADSTVTTGYCAITALDQTYHTQQIMTAVDAQNPAVAAEFSIAVTGGPVSVSFFANWGTSAMYEAFVAGTPHGNYVQNATTLTLNGSGSTLLLPPETSSEVTTTTTEPTTTAEADLSEPTTTTTSPEVTTTTPEPATTTTTTTAPTTTTTAAAPETSSSQNP